MATAELGQFVDLRRLAEAVDFRYDSAVYHCAYLSDGKKRTRVSIFSSGKMISVGSKSLDEAAHNLSYAMRRLTKLGLISPTRLKAKLQNIVATGDLGYTVDLERLSTGHPNIIYEPEQFPGAIYYAKELEGASILIFANGKVVFAGLKRQDLLDAGKRVLGDLTRKI